MWHPAPARSFAEASTLCSQYGGTLPVVTNKNKQCIVDSASYGSKIRVPVSTQSEEYITEYSATQPDKCSFLYNNEKIYPGECGVTPHMSAQSDYIVCEVPRDFITTSITARNIPILEKCHSEYDMCGVCGGPARSCLECQDGCLSGPPPEESSSKSSEKWQGSASFVAPVVVLCIVVVVLIAVVVSRKQRSRGRDVVEPPPNDIVSFENPQYDPPGANDGNSDIGYDQINVGTFIQETDGYLVPTTVNSDEPLYYQAVGGNNNGDRIYHNDAPGDKDGNPYDVVPGDSVGEENSNEPYYSRPNKSSQTPESSPTAISNEYDLAFDLNGNNNSDNFTEK